MNLLVIGNSEKLIRFVESIFPISHKYVVGWRSLPLSTEDEGVIARTQWDICLVAGYDYCSASYFFDHYIASNIENIMHFACACIPRESVVIYANTMAASKRYTFSRYLFAKMLLGNALVSAFPKTVALEFSTIIESGKIVATGGLISKYVFWLLHHFGGLKTVVINKSSEANTKLLHELVRKPIVPSPLLLKIPRPLMVDRFMRLILG